MKRLNPRLVVLCMSLGGLSGAAGAFSYLFRAAPLQVRQEALIAHGDESMIALAVEIERECAASGLAFSELEAQRLILALRTHGLQTSDLQAQCHSLLTRIQDELDSTLLYSVHPQKQAFVRNHQLFGQEVGDNFPSVILDIEEAGKCLAFELNTACVFHLMRVMELGLRVLGDTLQLPATSNRNWDAILKRCDDESKKAFKDKTPEWQKNEQFFAGATAMLRSVKDAWRNPTMHVDKVYTEQQTQDIWNAVQSFMRQLATTLKETP